VTELDDYKGLGTPIKLSRTPGGTRSKPPTYAQHTDEVFAEFGFSPDEVAALKAAGLFEAVQAKLVFGENIAQAAQYLQSGAAEAGLISSPQALAPVLAGGLVWTVPQALYPVQKQCGVLLKRSPQPVLAAAFQAYLLGPEAQATLARLGYGAP